MLAVSIVSLIITIPAYFAVNYSPLVLVVGLIVAIWWLVSAKNRYKGPVRTIDTDELGHEVEPPPEAPAIAGGGE